MHMKTYQTVYDFDVRDFLGRSATALGCDSQCVSNCVTWFYGIDQQAKCLDHCGCFDTGNNAGGPPIMFAQEIKQSSSSTWKTMLASYSVIALAAFFLYKRMFSGKTNAQMDREEYFVFKTE